LPHGIGVSARAGDAGYTLAEVASTLVVLTGLALILSPIFSDLLGAYHLRGATQELFGELQRIRLAAVMENHRYRLSIVGGTGLYEIHDDKDNDNADDSGEVTTRSVALENPGVILLGNDIVTFLPNGTALTYGTINLQNGNGRIKTLAVNSGGRIRVQ
jgi:Tfp pilus assembly protein FimT